MEEANGEKIDDATVTLSASNGWRATTRELYRNDGAGNEISYTFKERGENIYDAANATIEQIAQGYTSSIDMSRYAAGRITIENTHRILMSSIFFTKYWDDNNNEAGKRPDSVLIDVYANGKFLFQEVLTGSAKAGIWELSASYEDFDSNGNPIDYTFKEHEPIPGYYCVQTDEHIPELTNVYYPYGNLTISKNIENATEVSAQTSFNFKIEVQREDGSPDGGSYFWRASDGTTGSVENGGTVSVKGGQSVTIEQLPSECTYRVEEIHTSGWSPISYDYVKTGTIAPRSDNKVEFTNMYSAAGNVNFSARKVLEGTTLRSGQFVFELNRISDNGEKTLIGTASNTSDGQVTFGAITYNLADVGKTYHYQISEKDSGRAGYEYDKSVFDAYVNVIDNGGGSLLGKTTYSKDGMEIDTPTFTNKYRASGSVSPVAYKILKGQELQAGMFSFELIDKSTGESLGDIATNAADGSIAFNEIAYDETDAGQTYYYEMREVPGDDSTIVYSQETYLYEVKVRDNRNGTLSFDTKSYKPYANSENDNVEGDNGQTENQNIVEINGEPYIEETPVFTNDSVPGTLVLEKRVDGVAGEDYDPAAEFTFHVTLNSPGDYEFEREEKKDAWAVYTDDDKTMRFVRASSEDKAKARVAEVRGTALPSDANSVKAWTGFEELEGTANESGWIMYTAPDWSNMANTDRIDASSVERIDFVDAIRPKSIYQWFQDFINLSNVDHLENLDLLNCSYIGMLFYNCPKITTLDANLLDVKNVQSMDSVFCNTGMRTVDLSSWDTANLERGNSIVANWSGTNQLETLILGEKFVINFKPDGHNVPFDAGLLLRSTTTEKLHYVMEQTYNSETGYYDSYYGLPNGVYDIYEVVPKGYAVYTDDNVLTLNRDKNIPQVGDVYNGATVTRVYDYTSNYRGIDDVAGFQYTSPWKEIASDCVKVVINCPVIPAQLEGWFGQFYVLEEIEGLENISPRKVSSTSYMFYGCQKLSHISLINWQTNTDITASHMFQGCLTLESIDLSGSLLKVGNIAEMFRSCRKLSDLDTTKIELTGGDGGGFDGDFRSVFYDCYSLDKIQFANTHPVQYQQVNYAFSGCKASELDLSWLDDSNFRSYFAGTNVFEAMTNLERVTLPAITYPLGKKVANNDSQCSYLPAGTWVAQSDGSKYTERTIPSGKADTYVREKIPYVAMYGSRTLVFGNGYQVPTSYEGSSISVRWTGDSVIDWTTGENTLPPWLEEDTMDLTKVVIADDIYPKNTSKWFQGLQYVTFEGLEKIHVEDVNDFSYMFANCMALDNSDFLSSWNANSGADFSYMFWGCSKLPSAELIGWDFSHTVSMDSMFSTCTSMSNIAIVPSSKMPNNISMNEMFAHSTNISTIFVNQNWTPPISTYANMFQNCLWLTGGNGHKYDASNSNAASSIYAHIDESNTPGYFSEYVTTNIRSQQDAHLADENESVFSILNFLNPPVTNASEVGEDASHSSENEALKSAKGIPIGSPFVGEQQRNLVVEQGRTANNGTGLLMGTNSSAAMADQAVMFATGDIASGTSGTCTWVIDANGVLTIRPTSGSSGTLAKWTAPPWYNTNAALKVTKVQFSGNIIAATCKYMFASFQKLQSIDFTGFNTSNVTDMSYMFYGVGAYPIVLNLDLSKLNTSNVTNMSYMFASGLRYKTLTFGTNFNTSKVTNMSGMFKEHNQKIPSDISEFDMSNVTNMASMFEGSFFASKTYDLTKWNTSKVTNMNRLFAKAQTSYDPIKVTGWDTSNVENMSGIFREILSTTSGGITGAQTWNTSKVTDMSYACYKTQHCPVEKWNTSNVRNMSYMFAGSDKIYQLTLDWDVSNVTNMSYMFADCTQIKATLKGWNTVNVTNMAGMFQNCTSLQDINQYIGRWNTSNVKNMSSMFEGTGSLREYLKWDTSKVTNMSKMFKNSKMRVTFGATWNTAQVTNMSEMFSGWTGADNLYLPYFTMTSNTKTTNMFANTNFNTITVSEKFRFNNTVLCASPSPAYTGKWISFDAPEHDVAYEPETLSTMFDSNPSAYAGTWTWQKSTYTLSFDANGGSGQIADKTDIEMDAYVSLPTTGFYKFGQRISSWNTAADGSGTSYSVGTPVTIDGVEADSTLTLYAQWADEDTSIDASTGSFDVTVHPNETITIPNIPAGTTYTVTEKTPAGWNIVSEGTVGTTGTIFPARTSTASIQNEYTTNKTVANIQVIKKLDNTIPQYDASLDTASDIDGKFSFELFPADTFGSITGEAIGALKHNDLSGAVIFDPIEYTNVTDKANGDEYYYVIREQQNAPDMYNYADDILVKVKVTDDGAGHLSNTVTYNDTEKIPVMSNTSKPGSLCIRKYYGKPRMENIHPDTQFNFTVNLQYPDGAVETKNLQIGCGEEQVIGNLPAGTVFNITESDISVGWTNIYTSGNTGTITAGRQSAAEFYNRYESRPVSIVINATKKMSDGSAIPEDKYAFNLYSIDENATEIPVDSVPIQQAYAIENGEISFNMLTFDTPGVYRYAVREDLSSLDSIIEYDTHTEFIDVIVTDNGEGALIAQVTYDTDGAVFTNSYKAAYLKIMKTAIGVSEKFAERTYDFTVTLRNENGNITDGSYLYKIYSDNAEDENETDDIETAMGNISSGGAISMQSGQYALIEVPVNTSYEVIEKTPTGFICDSDGSTGNISAEQATNIVTATFTNTYFANGTVKLSAVKEVRGFDLADNQFSFALTDSDGRMVSTAKNDADGNVAFSAIPYTASDVGKTFVYTISEVNDGQRHISYDNSEYSAIVTVSDNGDGTLSTDAVIVNGEVAYAEDGSIDYDNMEIVEEGHNVFVNSYSLVLPESGQSGISLMIWLGILLVIAGLVVRRKNDIDNEREEHTSICR